MSDKIKIFIIYNFVKKCCDENKNLSKAEIIFDQNRIKLNNFRKIENKTDFVFEINC